MHNVVNNYNLSNPLHMQKHEEQTRERIGEITNRMNEVEEALRVHKMENERVLTAEIHERENQDKVGQRLHL